MPWNPLVPEARRIVGVKTAGRPAPPTHVVCHITGTNSLTLVIHEFTTSVSPHYLVDKAGLIYQFVPEVDQAWHAGIKSAVQERYAHPATDWQKYHFYFDWDHYPSGSVFLDRQLQRVQGGHVATYVAQSDGSIWDKYRYFRSRWGNGAGPLNYSVSHRPNEYSIGIEILSVGANTASAAAYTPAMYASLRTLVTDICTRNGIPMKKGTVLGHEDVNPMQRYGWDPNQGFDWSQVWS